MLVRADINRKEMCIPYFAYFINEVTIEEKILKLMEDYIYFAMDIDNAFEDIKKIIKKTDKKPDCYEETKNFFIKMALYNNGSISNKLVFYLNEWKSDSHTAKKILNIFSEKRIG
jgi:hypothetical protein